MELYRKLPHLLYRPFFPPQHYPPIIHFESKAYLHLLYRKLYRELYRKLHYFQHMNLSI